MPHLNQNMSGLFRRPFTTAAMVLGLMPSVGITQEDVCDVGLETLYGQFELTEAQITAGAYTFLETNFSDPSQVYVTANLELLPNQMRALDLFTSRHGYNGALAISTVRDLTAGFDFYHSPDVVKELALYSCNAQQQPGDPACVIYAEKRQVSGAAADVRSGLSYSAVAFANFFVDCISSGQYASIAATGWQGWVIGLGDSQAEADREAIDNCQTTLFDPNSRQLTYGSLLPHELAYIQSRGWQSCRISWQSSWAN